MALIQTTVLIENGAVIIDVLTRMGDSNGYIRKGGPICQHLNEELSIGSRLFLILP